MKPSVQNYAFSFPEQSTSMDPEAFDLLIKTQGTTLVHYSSQRCPVGLIDPDDATRRPHTHNEAMCMNGFLLTKMGSVTCAFMGNSKDSRFWEPGRMDEANVQIVVPRFYDVAVPACKDDVPVELAPFDRLYLADENMNVITWHLFKAHISGVDRLLFPAVSVQSLIDADGVRYKEGVDFDLQAGDVRWLNQRRPAADKVCSIRFRYRPFFYVSSLSHEIRVVQIEDEFTGERRTERMPQAASLRRETFYHKQDQDGMVPDPEKRQQPGPPSGGFGPR